jgi:hypothetical protein
MSYRIIHHIGEGPVRPVLDFGKPRLPGFPPNPFKEGTHNHRVWEWLAEHRQVTTQQIHHILHVDPTRVNNCKEKMAPDFTIKDAVPIPGERSNYLYVVERA